MFKSEEKKLTFPFWRIDTMYNECTTMHVREDGNISATLLFKPKRIIEIRNNSLDKVYIEGKDYTWDGRSNRINFVDGSDIAYFNPWDLCGKNEDGSYVVGWGDTAAGWTQQNPFDSLGRCRFADALFCTSSFVYDKQIAVTYEYEKGSWQGIVPAFQGDVLPKTMAKLKSKQKLDLVFYGDSIFTGCDSSRMHNRPPYQVSFPEFTKDLLSDYYDTEVDLYNPSVGGMDSAWGAANADTLVADRKPDLVIIGFGMNDGTKQGTETAGFVKSIMDTISAKNPDCEYIIVVPIVPNAKAGFLTTHGQLPQAYKDLTGPGKGYINMFDFHKEILNTKDYISTSGNDINHPNDWMIRVYTMNIMSALIDYAGDEL